MMLKRYLLCLLLAMACVVAWADNALTLSSASGVPGTEVELTVALRNSDAVTGVQLSIPLSEHTVFVDGSATLSPARADGHGISGAVKDGALQIVVYSLNKQPLKGSTGTLLTFRLRLGREPGTYTLNPTVTLAGAASSSLVCTAGSATVTIRAPKLEVVTPIVDFGRVPLGASYSSSITLRNTGTTAMVVSDIVSDNPAVSVLQRKFTLAAGATRAVTLDFSPTVRGAMNASLRILSDAINATQTVSVTADPFAVNELRVGSASGISDSEVTLAVTMDNMDAIVGVQCAMELPQGIDYADGSVKLTERGDQHGIRAIVDGRTLKFIVYSMTGTPLKGQSGDVFTFRLHLAASSGSYVLHPANVALGTREGVNVLSAASDGMVTVESPRMMTDTEITIPAASVTTGVRGVWRITNPSTLPLTISDVAFRDAGYEVEDALPLVVPAHGEQVLTIVYHSLVEGPFATTMNVYSNDPDARLTEIVIRGELYEPNSISISTTEEATMVVALDNYSDITGLQMDICLADAEAASLSVVPCERLAGFSYSLNAIDDTTWRLLVYAFDRHRVVEGHAGEILRFTCNDLSAKGSDPRVVLENVVLSGEGPSNRLTQGSVLVCSIPTAYSPLDANRDGRITIGDVVSIISQGSSTTIRQVEEAVDEILEMKE